jgi:hypothetical protein
MGLRAQRSKQIPAALVYRKRCSAANSFAWHARRVIEQIFNKFPDLEVDHPTVLG